MPTTHDETLCTERAATAPTDPLLAFVDCMIEATDTEQFFLWEFHSSESSGRPADSPSSEWIVHSREIEHQLGELAGHRVMLRYAFAVVDGAVLCFFSMTSRVTDRVLAREWADAVCLKREDAMNFNNRPKPGERTENAIRFAAEDEILRARAREQRRQGMPTNPNR